MNDLLAQLDENVSEEAKAQVYEIADACDRALRNGEGSNINESLQKVDPGLRLLLFRELIIDEIQYRTERHEPLPVPGDYDDALPGSQEVVRAVLAYYQAELCNSVRDGGEAEKDSTEGLWVANREADQCAKDTRRTSLAKTSCKRVACPNCSSDVHLAELSQQQATCLDCGNTVAIEPHQSEVDRNYPSSYGHFVILRELGAGGCGVVYKAYDEELERICALKVIREEVNNEESEERFRREARTLAELKHPNIVKIYFSSIEKGKPYIVTEFINGQTLAETLAGAQDTTGNQQLPFSAKASAHIVLQIARALRHAHEGGVIHRDVKPRNIIIDEEGVPLLLDFGLARRTTEETLTHIGQVLGTPLYMSPEQARYGGTITHQSDIFSLGVVLFELLTGHHPFRGQELETKDAPSARELNPQVPRDLNTICLKCLEKDPESRYQTAKELEEDIRRFEEGEPIHAQPISKFTRAWRWCRRNPRDAGMIGAILLLLSVVAVMAIYMKNLSERETKVATRLIGVIKRMDAIDTALLTPTLQLDPPSENNDFKQFPILDALVEGGVERDLEYARLVELAVELEPQIDDFLEFPSLHTRSIEMLRKFGSIATVTSTYGGTELIDCLKIAIDELDNLEVNDLERSSLQSARETIQQAIDAILADSETEGQKASAIGRR